jgi:hypothetical protein
MNKLYVLPLVLLMFGCMSDEPESAPSSRAVLVLANGQRLCGRHGIPLVTVEAFSEPRSPAASEPAGEGSMTPNRLPEGMTLTKDSTHTVSRQIMYCPKCEAEAGRSTRDAGGVLAPESSFGPPKGSRWR